MGQERKIVAARTVETRGFLQRDGWSGGSCLPRVAALRPYVVDRDVLDVGCASGRWRPDWVHGQLVQSTRTVIGIDLDREAVEELRGSGYDVRFGDAERLALGQEFDVIIAGELLEHLDSFRGFFESVRRHLRPGGRLVLTTPNAFAFSNFIYRLGGVVRVNRDHVCWFCEVTLQQLLERNGYVVEELKYLHFDSPGRVRGRVAGMARRVLPDQLAWPTLIAVTRAV